MQQIAEEAGIGKGTVYEYFTSREEIISKAMAYRLRGEADALSERVDKAEGFEQKLDTLLCFARDSVQAQACLLYTSIPTAILIALADFYGTSTDYILGRTDEK